MYTVFAELEALGCYFIKAKSWSCNSAITVSLMVYVLLLCFCYSALCRIYTTKVVDSAVFGMVRAKFRHKCTYIGGETHRDVRNLLTGTRGTNHKSHRRISAQFGVPKGES